MGGNIEQKECLAYTKENIKKSKPCSVCKENNDCLYCVHCDLWYCPSCKEIHDELSNEDLEFKDYKGEYKKRKHLFISNEFHFDIKCEDCDLNLFSSLYCKECDKRLCPFCYYINHNEHALQK